jgi:hypothetical protein
VFACCVAKEDKKIEANNRWNIRAMREAMG